MKKSLVFALAMALGVSATAFAANPFSDLPAGHWAYGAVAKLAAAGVVDGYPDGTFKTYPPFSRAGDQPKAGGGFYPANIKRTILLNRPFFMLQIIFLCDKNMKFTEKIISICNSGLKLFHKFAFFCILMVK